MKTFVIWQKVMYLFFSCLKIFELSSRLAANERIDATSSFSNIDKCLRSTVGRCAAVAMASISDFSA
ncbi:MAG: hypothetical protein U0X91_18405 [Spirosomataceae bacterium]